MLRIRSFVVLGLAAALVAASGTYADASHAWGSYHWARASNPFELKLGDNMTTGEWKSILGVVSADWSQSSVLDTVVTAGKGGRSCKAQTGRVEVCNGRYGFNGWVGLAQIWISGSHITKGTAKMNDSYLNSATYAPYRRYVMCQEVGHTLGLGHTSEDGTNDGTCMDYSWQNETPNAHDYEQLEAIYNDHFDTVTTAKGPGNGNGNGAPDQVPGFADDGTPIGASADRGRVYVSDLPSGERVVTFIFWARGR